MIRINEHYLNLKASYLFSEIAQRVRQFQEDNPAAKIIRMGIGDVTEPLPAACIRAMQEAVAEMGERATFRGYGPEQGYDFLREAIAENDYRARGVTCVTAKDIFVSDGAKCDTGNFQELFSPEASVAITDPVYPVYVDSNVMAGRSGAAVDGRYQKLLYLDCTPAKGFIPELPSRPVDVIYLCSPNNPTGVVMDKDALSKWVAYAKEHGSLILFDAAYEAFIQDPALPRSIYEIPGADEVAVEFRSFSKTAGFTGTRCAFTVVPANCRAFDAKGNPVALRDLWNRRQSTKFNGVPYIIQRAAAAVYSPEGQKQCQDLISFYLENAALIKSTLSELGYACAGADHAPYIWINTGIDSWEFFDTLLKKAGVVCTPGVGFGKCGQGFVRLSAFNSRENVVEALSRLRECLR